MHFASTLMSDCAREKTPLAPARKAATTSCGSHLIEQQDPGTLGRAAANLFGAGLAVEGPVRQGGADDRDVGLHILHRAEQGFAIHVARYHGRSPAVCAVLRITIDRPFGSSRPPQCELSSAVLPSGSADNGLLLLREALPSFYIVGRHRYFSPGEDWLETTAGGLKRAACMRQPEWRRKDWSQYERAAQQTGYSDHS